LEFADASPAFYETLAESIRDDLRTLFRSAQVASLGLWEQDRTLKGATITSKDDLQQLAL
jgi:hypothetical protein